MPYLLTQHAVKADYFLKLTSSYFNPLLSTHLRLPLVFTCRIDAS